MLTFKARPRKDPSLSSELTPSQRRMMRTLRDARQEVQAQLRNRRAEMMRLLMHASTRRIIDAVPTNPWYTAQQELQANLQAELISAGRRVQLPAIQKASVKFKFDDERREAAAWAYKEAGRLVQDITLVQGATIASLVARAELGEFTPDEVARVLRQMEEGIGLTDQQVEWVDNYRERYIADQMSQGRTLSEAQERAEKPTNRYADRIYRYRTETIARTEIMRASNEGRNQAWQQGIEGGWINPDALKVWSVEVDGRECSTCRPLGDLDPIPINDSFPQGDPPVHPNCRCTVRLTDEIPQDLMDMTDDELEAEIDRLINTQPRDADGTQSRRSWADTPDMQGGTLEEREFLAEVQRDFEEIWTDAVGIDGARVVVRTTRRDSELRVLTEVTHPDGRNILRASRRINPRSGYVDHTLFDVAPSFQGSGIATRANARFFDLYKERGMTEVRLIANIDVGGYTWAKQGFDWDFDEMNELADDAAYMQIYGFLDTAERNADPDDEGVMGEIFALQERIEGDREQWPTPLEIAMLGRKDGDKTWLGKETMLGTSWEGRLAL